MQFPVRCDDCGHGPMATPGEVRAHVDEAHPEVGAVNLLRVVSTVKE